LLFTWAVESINGVRNFSGVGGAHLPDPKYYEFVDLLLTMQQSGSVGFEVKEDPEIGQTVVFFFGDQSMSEDERSNKQRIRILLGLDPDQNEFTVRYSPFALEGNVLAMQTRSVIQVLNAMARFVDVPVVPDRELRGTGTDGGRPSAAGPDA
jgi:hypothetical protein